MVQTAPGAAAEAAAGGGGSAPCPPLAVDCRSLGSVGRFVRRADKARGEAPNLVRQAVFTDLRNPFAPRLALFAKTHLAPGAELLL